MIIMKNNKFFLNSVFENNSSHKKVLIIVPHEDDETILSGNLIELLMLNGHEVNIAYLTNGDYKLPADIRLNEAIRALKIYGISDKHIYFLGYPDTQFGTQTSLIETNSTPYISNAGKAETYSIEQYEEFCFQTDGVHHSYLGSNVLNDIEGLIKFLYPDIIICTDYDKHPDHMAVSYGIDNVLDKILKNNNGISYNPVLWKSFAYSLHYFADEGLKNVNVKSTLIPNASNVSNDFNFINKSIYQWDNRIRIPNSPFNKWGDLLYKQHLFKALACHKSQFAATRIGRIWNGDEIYWERRTDNLLSGAHFFLNGHNVNTLGKFYLFKPKNFSESHLEMIDDSLKLSFTDILIIKSKKISIKQLVIYGFIGNECDKGRFELSLSNGYTTSFEFMSKYGSPFEITFPTQHNIEWIKLQFRSSKQCHISRIEAFSQEKVDNNIVKPFIKILINNTFTNYYYIFDKKSKLVISMYKYNLNDSVKYEILQGDAVIENNEINIISLKQPIIMQASGNNGMIYDQVIISKKNKMLYNIKQFINKRFMNGFRMKSHVYIFINLCKLKGIKMVISYYREKLNKKYKQNIRG